MYVYVYIVMGDKFLNQSYMHKSTLISVVQESWWIYQMCSSMCLQTARQ